MLQIKKESRKNLVPSVNKAFDIVTLLFRKGSLTLKDITYELKIPASTCYNIVSTLEHRGVIQKDGQTNCYELGMSLMKWGLKAYNNVDIRKVAVKYLHKLVERFNETATVTVFNQASYESIVIDVVEGTELLRTSPRIGARYPLHVTGAGMCFLSSLPADGLTNYFELIQGEQLIRPISEEKVRANLQSIKENGYAVTVNELGTNAASVGAGIRNNVQEIHAAISISGPAERMKEQIPEMIKAVKSYADEISTRLYGNQ